MKNIIKTITLLLLVIATASSCKKDDSPSLVDSTIQKETGKSPSFRTVVMMKPRIFPATNLSSTQMAA